MTVYKLFTEEYGELTAWPKEVLFGYTHSKEVAEAWVNSQTCDFGFYKRKYKEDDFLYNLIESVQELNAQLKG